MVLGRKTMKDLDSILKSRDITLPTKIHIVKLDHKEGWAPKNWCFWTVVLDKILESALDCKQIKSVNSKGNQSWIFIGGLNIHCWSWSSNTLATWCKEQTHWKRPWCWEKLKAGEGHYRGWDGWMASPTQWTWVWVKSGFGDGQRSLVYCSPWGHKELETTERLNWTQCEQK